MQEQRSNTKTYQGGEHDSSQDVPVQSSRNHQFVLVYLLFMHLVVVYCVFERATADWSHQVSSSQSNNALSEDLPEHNQLYDIIVPGTLTVVRV